MPSRHPPLLTKDDPALARKVLQYCAPLDLVRWKRVSKKWKANVIPPCLRVARISRMSRIRFDEGPHKYYVDDKPVGISVTGFIHAFVSEFDTKGVLDRWWPHWQEKGHPVYKGMSKYEIREMWDEEKRNAGALGTDMHAHIEQVYKGGPAPDDNSVEFAYFLRFRREMIRLGYTPYLVEARLFYEELDLAGSCDMVFRKSDGTLAVYDWKRSRHIRTQAFEGEKMKEPLDHLDNTNWFHYALQVNIYARMLRDKYGEHVTELAIVVFHPKNPRGSFQKFTMPFMDKEIEAMFDWRRKELEMKRESCIGTPTYQPEEEPQSTLTA